MQRIKALYGTFNLDMLPIDTEDVSEKLAAWFTEDKITIPKNIFSENYFGEDDPSQFFFLQVSTAGKTFNFLSEQYIEDIQIDVKDNARHIKIVYFLYVSHGTNWRGIVSGQLLQLKSYGILSEADLYIHITDCYGLGEAVEELIRDIAPAAIISFSLENLFEYPGIKLIYELAIQFPEDYFIYFHAKGMSHNLHSRSTEEVTLFTETFKSWRKNIQLLNKNGVHKIGLFPAILEEKIPKQGDIGGWIWYNYWYATGKYLGGCPEPKITRDKYYYEGWLALQKGEEKQLMGGCRSIYQIKNVAKDYFTPTEADYYLSIVPKQGFNFSKRVINVLGKAAHAYYYLQIGMYLNTIKKIARNFFGEGKK